MSSSDMREEPSHKKLIVNVDPGIDDAQAILMALAHPNVQILALCLNHGNTSIKNTVINILKMLTVIGRLDIPVYLGSGHAIHTQPAHGDDYFGKDGFGDYDGYPHPNENLIQPEHAVFKMIELVKDNPGEITMVNLSPLTNLAMAHRLYPDFSKKLKDCFIMGGNYKGRGNITSSAEFNFYMDAEAANVVLTEFQCPISLSTWELSLKSALTWEFHDSLRKIPSVQSEMMNNLESKLIKEWKKNGPYIICDELAMAAVLNEKCLVKSKKVSVQVECHGQLTRGQTVIDWEDKSEKPRNVCLVLKMDMEIVKRLLEQTYWK